MCSQAAFASDADMLYVPNSATLTGTTTRLEVMLNNPYNAVRAIQFYITLPEGMTFVKTSSTGSNYDYQRNRIPNGFIVSHKTPVGMDTNVSLVTMYVISASTVISQGTGTIITLPINIPVQIDEGYYPILLDQVVVTMEGQSEHIEHASSTLAVSPYLLGDADTNGTINADDITATAFQILGHCPQPFSAVAADINIDQAIDVADVIKMVKE